MNTMELKIYELTSRIDAHEAKCEERDKTIFNRLESIEKRLDDLNSLLTKLAVILITGMGGILITMLMRA